MKAPLRTALVILGLAMSGSIARAQTTPGPAAPLLGRGHLWVKGGQIDLGGDADRAWGVSRGGYLALEGYFGVGRGFYWGGEIGHSGKDSGVSATGDRIRDFNLLWLELNGKKAFDLKHGLAIDIGGGASFFYAGGDEVTTLGGSESTDTLWDIGLGSQAFADFTWRSRRLLLGMDAKYQWAFDVIDVDYSNLRLGVHLGMVF